jgi:glycosyltransferase involved in cell wall biosynthesis
LPPRLLLVGQLPPPTGGVATHLAEIRRAVDERGVAVDLADPRDHTALLLKLVRARLRGDLIHLHTNGHNRGSWLLSALCAGPRSILTLHSGLAPAFIARHPVTRAVAAAYAEVIAVNREIAHAVGTDVILAAWTPRSLDFRLAPPGLGRLRARHRPLFAAAVAPGPEYGATLLLDAFARLPHPQKGLLVYGPGSRALAGEVGRRGLRGAVALLGELTRERALAVLAACDVFVRPTLADGDALSVREALALGRPVVASSVGHRPEGALTFCAGSAANCAELLFHAAERAAPAPASPSDDCLPALLKIYGIQGLPVGAVPVGTALAI